MVLSSLPVLVNGRKQVYLDHNATTPVALDLLPHLESWVSQWGNPSSIHQSGRGPKTLIRDARRSLAQFLGCDPLEIIFTSGGSESNNLVLKGVFEQLLLNGEGINKKRYITSAVEHPSVLKTLQFLAAKGGDVVLIPVDRGGRLDLAALEKALKEKPTALVSVMAANNETGSIFPIEEIVRLSHQYGALVHSDMVQALGKIPLNLKNLGLDYASFSGHKFYSLKGGGVLFARKNRPLVSLIHGGAQERSRRAGTENTLAIAALGEMAKRGPEVEPQNDRIRKMRDQLECEILSRIPGVEVTGAGVPRLSGSLSLVIAGIDGETLLMNLDMKGFSVSTGAACSSGSPEPSPVLLAMGLSREEAQASLRVGLGWSTSQEEVDQFLEALVATVERLRSFQHGLKFVDSKRY
jgi:cysteine desulfurase